ncbi:AAA family ATPase, partial [Streptococcus pyogenes]
KASLLDKTDILKNEAILKSKPLEKLDKFDSVEIKFSKYVDSVNEIITSKVEEKTRIERFTSAERINFAESGYHIHKKGDICAFCGNLIRENIFEELESYFSADEVKLLQDRIAKGKEKISSIISTL